MLKKENIDFRALFEFWACSRLNIYDFAIGIGVDTDLNMMTVLECWPNNLKDAIKINSLCPVEWRETARAKVTGSVKRGSINWEVYSRKLKTANAMEVYEPEILNQGTETPESLTQKIIRWRESQAIADWRTAERLRRYVVGLLDRVTRDLDSDEAYNFGAQAVRQIAAAMVDLQKMQRLALGLSSENIGFPLSGVSQGGEQIPIVNFNVTDKK